MDPQSPCYHKAVEDDEVARSTTLKLRGAQQKMIPSARHDFW